jgi:hypothetical protein
MGSALDVAIGLVFLYLLLALMVTTVQELVASVLDWRAKNLYAAIEDMLKNGESSPLVKKLYEHPLVRNLVQKGRGKLPSYIPSKTFAIALLDVLQEKTSVSTAIGADKALAGAKELVDKLPSTFHDLKKTLNLLIGDAQRYEEHVDRQAARFSEGIEAWFNDRMARAAGWYKRKAQYFSLALAAAVSVAANASSIDVAAKLWKDASLRAAVVASAQAAHDQAAASLMSSPLPIGWSGGWAAGWGGWLTPVGWAITALAVSLGSAFWFDALGKLLQLRSTGARVSAVDGKTSA